MRTVVKLYRYECDQEVGGQRCPVRLEVSPGQTHMGYPRPVETASDADWVAKASGWRYAGSKAYCPEHAGGAS